MALSGCLSGKRIRSSNTRETRRRVYLGQEDPWEKWQLPQYSCRESWRTEEPDGHSRRVGHTSESYLHLHSEPRCHQARLQSLLNQAQILLSLVGVPQAELQPTAVLINKVLLNSHDHLCITLAGFTTAGSWLVCLQKTTYGPASSKTFTKRLHCTRT